MRFNYYHDRYDRYLACTLGRFRFEAGRTCEGQLFIRGRAKPRDSELTTAVARIADTQGRTRKRPEYIDVTWWPFIPLKPRRPLNAEELQWAGYGKLAAAALFLVLMLAGIIR